MVAQVEWVLLSYRMPREPSTPRIAVWRRLRELGVVQVVDGLVALPADERTIEALHWVAVQVEEADGTAIVWRATSDRQVDADALVELARAARADEYAALLDEVRSAVRPVDRRTIARWRRTWRRIERRDHFGAPGRDEARLAIAELVAIEVPAPA